MPSDLSGTCEEAAFLLVGCLPRIVMGSYQALEAFTRRAGVWRFEKDRQRIGGSPGFLETPGSPVAPHLLSSYQAQWFGRMRPKLDRRPEGAQTLYKARAITVSVLMRRRSYNKDI